MNNVTWSRGARWIAGSVVFLAAGMAHAQYVWINENGVRQISDKAPPANTPAKKILKSPGGSLAEAPAPTPSPSGPLPPKDGQTITTVETPGAPKPPGQMTLAEREADYKKRMAAAAEKEDKDKAERKQKAQKKAQCESARQYKVMLESNRPITSAAPDAQNGYMTEAERKKQGQQNKQVLDDCR